MKLYITLLAGLLFLASCNTQKVMKNEEQEYKGKKILVGEINEDNFKVEPYNDWFPMYYDAHKTNTEIIDKIADELKGYEVKVFMGTWCGDSRQWTPAFFKVMDYAHFPQNQIHMYAVDREKHSLNEEEKGLNISHVPTFIFLKNGKEAGRIVEAPINTLEEDIRDIVNGKPQKPNYAE